LLQRARAAPVTAVVIAVNVAVFLWMGRDGAAFDAGTLIRFGALEPFHVWAGEYWRLGSYMFLHGGWLHIALNMYMAAGWASALERALGSRRFALVYFLSGLVGGCASVVSSWLFSAHMSVGASGALFGVVGAVLALRRRQLRSFEAFFADPGIRSLLVQIAIWTAIGLTALNFDNAAHLGGLATGFVVTWLLTSQAPRLLWLALAAALGALFIFAARPWWTPGGEDANELLLLSRSYLTGQSLYTGGKRPWPRDIARGERFLEKGCKHGVAAACDELADHLTLHAAPDAATRAEELRRRGCDLDPGHCLQLH
jgi:membrane associated rhomboid family serine protease